MMKGVRGRRLGVFETGFVAFEVWAASGVNEPLWTSARSKSQSQKDGRGTNWSLTDPTTRCMVEVCEP